MFQSQQQKGLFTFYRQQADHQAFIKAFKKNKIYLPQLQILLQKNKPENIKPRKYKEKIKLQQLKQNPQIIFKQTKNLNELSTRQDDKKTKQIQIQAKKLQRIKQRKSKQLQNYLKNYRIDRQIQGSLQKISIQSVQFKKSIQIKLKQKPVYTRISLSPRYEYLMTNNSRQMNSISLSQRQTSTLKQRKRHNVSDFELPTINLHSQRYNQVFENKSPNKNYLIPKVRMKSSVVQKVLKSQNYKEIQNIRSSISQDIINQKHIHRYQPINQPDQHLTKSKSYIKNSIKDIQEFKSNKKLANIMKRVKSHFAC